MVSDRARPDVLVQLAQARLKSPVPLPPAHSMATAALACGGANAPASVRGVARKSNTSERAVSGASSSPAPAVPRRLRVPGAPPAARSALPRALCWAASRPSSSAALSPPAPPLPGAGVCRSSKTSRGVSPLALAPAAGVSRACGGMKGTWALQSEWGRWACTAEPCSSHARAVNTQTACIVLPTSMQC